MDYSSAWHHPRRRNDAYIYLTKCHGTTIGIKYLSILGDDLGPGSCTFIFRTFHRLRLIDLTYCAEEGQNVI